MFKVGDMVKLTRIGVVADDAPIQEYLAKCKDAFDTRDVCSLYLHGRVPSRKTVREEKFEIRYKTMNGYYSIAVVTNGKETYPVFLGLCTPVNF